MILSGGYGIAIWQEIPDTWEHYFGLFNNILLKSGNKYYTYEDDGFIEVEPTEENFKKYGMMLNEIIQYINEIIFTMIDSGNIGIGKIYRRPIDLNKIDEINRIDILLSMYTLFKENNEIFYFDGTNFINTNLIEPLTQQNFEQYGMTDTSIIPKEKIAELGNIEILTWTSNTDIPQVKLTIPETKLYKLFDDPYIVSWSDSTDNPIIDFTGKIDIINRFEDINILGYSYDENIEPSGTVSGISKDNYYKYRVTVNDTTTTEDIDDILIDWQQDYITHNIANTIVIPANYINKVNPYFINVDVEQFDNKTISAYGQVLLYNLEPIFMLGAVSFNTLSVTIDDPDRDMVQCQIILNGERIYPEYDEWSYPSQTPFPLIYKIDRSKINIGTTNFCIVNARDQFGVQASLDLSFVGSYDGLLFADTNNNYYSLDPETILKRLDFGTIIAGFNSDIAEVKLINRNAFKVKNIQITLDKQSIQPYTDVLISKTGGNNFIPTNNLLYTEEIDSGEEIKFYVKIQTDILASGFSQFGIQAQADIVDNI